MASLIRSSPPDHKSETGSSTSTSISTTSSLPDAHCSARAEEGILGLWDEGFDITAVGVTMTFRLHYTNPVLEHAARRAIA